MAASFFWYGAVNSANYRRFYNNKLQRGREKLVYTLLKVKYLKMFVFVLKKRAFVGTDEATIYELLLCTKYKIYIKTTQFLAKISSSRLIIL